MIPVSRHTVTTSYDAFMTRQFVTGMRPVASPDDPNVITSACESAPLQTIQGAAIQLSTQFWVKGQPYSLADILSFALCWRDHLPGIPVRPQLSLLASSHQRRGPQDCAPSKAPTMPRTTGRALHRPAARILSGPNNSQPSHLPGCHAQHHAPGEHQPEYWIDMAIIPVGMAEVSSCEWTVKETQIVQQRGPDRQGTSARLDLYLLFFSSSLVPLLILTTCSSTLAARPIFFYSARAST